MRADWAFVGLKVLLGAPAGGEGGGGALGGAAEGL